MQIQFRGRKKLALRAAAMGGIRRRNRASRELQSSSTPWRVFGVGTPVLLTLLQLHFYNSSPFDTHPANMWTAVFAGFICCIALGKDTTKSSKSFRNIRVQVGYISGLLASAALISIVVPPSFEPFVFVAWMIASTMFVNVTRNWILRVAKKLYYLAKNAVSYVQDTCKRIIGNNSIVRATALPV